MVVMGYVGAYNSVECELEYPIAILRLNRPDKLNAFSLELQQEVRDILPRLEADDEVRAVILCGAGRAFSAGYDLGADEPQRPLDWKAVFDRDGSAYWRAVWDFRKPIIAAVHGYCLGGACEIAMLCDLTIASEDCKFGEPEIRFGGGSTLVMPWYLPLKITKELLLTGKMISAQRAYEVGMVNEVVPADKLLDRAKYHARLMSKIDPVAMQLTKEGLNRTYEIMGLVDAIRYHDNLVAIMFGTETPESKAFNEIRDRDGVRAALTWRDQQFKEVEDGA
jgi:enoyl-CoA hydratase/carnithine racemase